MVLRDIRLALAMEMQGVLFWECVVENQYLAAGEMPVGVVSQMYLGVRLYVRTLIWN